MSYKVKGGLAANSAGGSGSRALLCESHNDLAVERGVVFIHPENIFIGPGVYVGHNTILEGYHNSEMRIGSGTWIGAMCYFHSAGGLTIGKNVGIGPGVRILTSTHQEAGRAVPILKSPLQLSPVVIEDDSDIGVNAVILPGVTIGKGAQVGAGAVVSRDVPAYAVVIGVPAKVIRYRPEVAGSPQNDEEC